MSAQAALPRLFWISPGLGVGAALEARLRACVRAGLRAFQLREKGSFSGDLFRAVRDWKPLLAEGLFLVNERVDVACAAGADGVHLGMHGLPMEEARKLLGPEARIGASVHDAAELDAAIRGGADFAFVSPVYPVHKPGHKTLRPLGQRGLRALVERSTIPIFGLGGITPERVAEVLDAGAHGVAVLSGIARAEDPGATVRAYLQAIEEAS